MAALTLLLPWPPGGLLPNAASRMPWPQRRRLASEYHDHCWGVLQTQRADWRRDQFMGVPVRLGLTFCGRSGGGDLDNLLAACKPAIDALVRAKILADDGPRHVVEISVRREVCAELAAWGDPRWVRLAICPVEVRS